MPAARPTPLVLSLICHVVSLDILVHLSENQGSSCLSSSLSNSSAFAAFATFLGFGFLRNGI